MEILEEEAGPRLDPAGVRALQAYYAESPMRPLWTPRRSFLTSSLAPSSQPRQGLG